MQNWYGPSQILYPNIFPHYQSGPMALGPGTNMLLSTKDIFLFGVTMPMLAALMGLCAPRDSAKPFAPWRRTARRRP